MSKKPSIESPCTENCRLDVSLQYCIGCWRDARDIQKWIHLSGAERLLALRRRKRNKIKHLRLFAEKGLNANTEKNRDPE